MRRFLTLGFEYEIAVGQSLEEPQTRPRRGSTKSVIRKSRGLCKPEGQLCLDPASQRVSYAWIQPSRYRM